MTAGARTFSASGQQATLSAADGIVRISGALTFHTVPEMGGALGHLVADAQRIDLSAMDRIDSAGVALLLDTLLMARREGRDVRVVGIPVRMQALIDVYGIGAFIHDAPAAVN